MTMSISSAPFATASAASKAFAVADHQIAHIYLNDTSCALQVMKLLEEIDGVDKVLDKSGKIKYGLDHERSGDLVAISTENSWFTYYYWLDDQRAPDFARTVDIHKKPGYDPVEMFLNPSPLTVPKLIVRLLGKKIGFRTLMDVIPLNANLVKGSHGALVTDESDRAILVGDFDATKEEIEPTAVHDEILKQIFQNDNANNSGV